MDLSGLKFVLDVNITGTIDLVRQSLVHMIKNKPTDDIGERGVIIMVSSSAAFDGQPGQVSYAASKGAVASLTLPLARDLARYGVRAVTVAPSLFESGMTRLLSDKVRMDAYGTAILKNPSLLNGAVVMDVGCGTGILSLFAARAGASRVIAIEASAKMAAVASKVANDNGVLHCKTQSQADGLQKGVMEVVQGMVEEVDKNVELQPHSVDVLLSEWMGYCLLYESMLSSVLYARDRWLKPGGAILPDTATIVSSPLYGLCFSKLLRVSSDYFYAFHSIPPLVCCRFWKRGYKSSFLGECVWF